MIGYFFKKIKKKSATHFWVTLDIASLSDWPCESLWWDINRWLWPKRIIKK
jgi:hypothetical protein